MLKAQLDEQARLLAERGMVLVGNEDEDTTCEDEDRANANGKSFLWCLFSKAAFTFNISCYEHAYINDLITFFEYRGFKL